MSAVESELPINSRIMLCAIQRVLKAPAYVKSDDEHRAWRILLSVSEALHSAGVSGFASAGVLREMRRVSRRNTDIRREYNGRNLKELADKYNLCARQIRRIARDKTVRSKRDDLSDDISEDIRDEIKGMAEAQEAALKALRLTPG